MKKVLKSVRIRIPGVWADGWLYKEHVVLWSLDGSLCFVPVSEIRKAVLSNAGYQVAVASDYLIFRNDWKYSAQFTGLMRIPQVSASLFGFFGKEAETVVDVGNSAVRTSGKAAHSGYVLDTEVYANRIYSAGEEGLFETEFNPEFPDADNPTLQASGELALSVAAKSGKIAVSLGDEGLSTRNIAIGDGAEWWRAAKREKLETVDDYSLGVSFSAYNLLNYRGDDAPRLLRAKTKRVPPEGYSQFSTVMIDMFEPPVDFTGSLVQAFQSDDKVDFEFDMTSGIASRSANAIRQGTRDFRVVGNSNYHLLVSGPEGSSIVNISAFDEKPIQLLHNRNYKEGEISSGLVSASLSTQTLRSGFLLETFDKIGIITEQGSHIVIDDPRVRIRSFPRSKRHHDCFLAIGDDFVELVGFVELDE